jgi:hypothetical protein
METWDGDLVLLHSSLAHFHSVHWRWVGVSWCEWVCYPSRVSDVQPACAVLLLLTRHLLPPAYCLLVTYWWCSSPTGGTRPRTVVQAEQGPPWCWAGC